MTSVSSSFLSSISLTPMHFAHLLVSLGSAIVASSLTLNTRSLPSGFDSAGCYGAPTPPWEKGCHPGWYYGDHPKSYPDVFCLTPVSFK